MLHQQNLALALACGRAATDVNRSGERSQITEGYIVSHFIVNL